MPLHRLTSITVGVPDVDAARGFYSLFGLTESAPCRFATVEGGEQLIVEETPQRCLRTLGLGVDDLTDLEVLSARLAQHGYPSETGDGVLHVQDPGSGLALHIDVADRIERTEPVADPPVNGPGRCDRVDVRAAAVTSSGPARPLRLGHIALSSAGIEDSLRFFIDGLGFTVSDRAFGSAFIRCSTDHHNMVIQPGPSYMHHSAWELARADEIGLSVRHVLDEQPDADLWGMGRHGIGSNLFWYLRDPAGHYFEYYTDMDVISDDGAWVVKDWTTPDSLSVWGPAVPPEFLAPTDVSG